MGKVEKHFEQRQIKSLQEKRNISQIPKYLEPEEQIKCQTLIVKRRGKFYLLLNAGPRKASTGLINFEPEIEGWQQVWVKENPSSTSWLGHNMRVLQLSSNMESLDDILDNCYSL